MAFDLNKQKTTKIKGFDLGKGTTKYVAPKFVEDKKVIIVPELKKVATLPAHLGGGAYNLGKPGELIITERDYPMQSETGQWREHIIPVALGGTGGDNVKMYGKEKGEEKTKYEKEQINLYKQGKISLSQARLNVLTKYQQLIGLSPTPEEMTVKGQIIPAVKDLPKTIARDGDFVPPKLKTIVDVGKTAIKTVNSFLDLFKKKPALQATLTPEGKKVVQRQIQLQQQETSTPIKKDFIGSLPNYYSNKANVETENNIIKAAMPLMEKERKGIRLNEDEKAFKDAAQAALENRVTAMVLNAGPGSMGEIRNGFSYIARSKNTDEIYGVIKPFFTNQADDVVRTYADDLKGITNETKVSSYLFDKLNKTDGIGLYKVVPEQASMIKALEAPVVPPVATTPKPTTPSNIPKLKIVGKEPVVAPEIIPYKKPTTKMTFAEPKAPPSQEVDPLIQEADKVIAKSKTLEEAIDEFVKAQPTGYHFTSPETKITKWSTKKSQGRIWFTDNPNVGENVGASGKGKMYTVQFDKNAKWATPEQAEKSFTDQLISDGYDGVFHPDSTGEYGNYYEVFNPKVIKTKSQLADIVKERWNKAQEKAVKPTPKPKKTQGEGKISEISPTKKVSGVAKSIEAKAIEQGMIEGGFDKLADYGSSTFEEQVRKTSKLMENMSEVRKIVRGEKELPNDIKSAPLLAALEKYAKVNKDYELQYELANSPLATKISEAGSELSFARMREKDSATVKLQEIKKAREAKAEKKGRNTKEAKKKIKEEMEKTNLTKEELSWDNFLDELSC